MIKTSIRLCRLKRHFIQTRYIFQDNEGFYYLWQLSFSEYGLEVNITSLKHNDKEFVLVENKKVELIVEYLDEMLKDKSSSFLESFFESITFSKFEIEDKYLVEFCEIS